MKLNYSLFATGDIMIVKIVQTASNIKQLYYIQGENFSYQGDVGNLSKLQNITISNDKNNVKADYFMSPIDNYIPFRFLFGGGSKTRVFCLYKNDNLYGTMLFLKKGFFDECYVIALDNGMKLNCYFRSIDSFNYVSVYYNNQQIALVETYLNVTDNKYTHKLYILDEYNELAETLSLFVLYYASYTFTRRFHMSKSSVYVKAWSYSVYNDKYDPHWREDNFPDENFFGQLNRFK